VRLLPARGILIKRANLQQPASQPASALPRSAILWLALVAFIASTAARVTDAQLPRLASEFGVSLGAASLVITCFSVAFGVSQLFFGPFGDRFGKYLVIGWASLACAVTTGLCALAPSFPLLLVARLLAGATAAAIIPLSLAWIGDVVPYERRQPVLARFLLGQIIGLSSGVMLGGFAADHLDWRTPFFGIAFAFAATSMVLLSVNRRLPEQARLVRKAEGSALRRTLTEFGHVLSSRWARTVLFTVFLEGAFVYGAFAFIASHLHEVYGISLSRAGSLVMLFGFGGALFAATSATLVRRLGEVGLAGWGGGLIGTALLVTALAPSWQWAIPGCFVAGLGFYMLHNTLQTNATQMAPERRGAAVSSFACCFFLGQSAGIAMAGALVERIGTTSIIVIGALGGLALATNFGRLRSRKLAVHS
jgi:predicted MFS family arabinose efflux permease